VSIRAREESWVSITSDGKALPSQLLAADSEVAIHARKQIAIKVGNAGGVELRFNGNRVAAGGDFGEVKTVTFGPTGLLESTLTP
jgi:cytoskeleton protein RodZ